MHDGNGARWQTGRWKKPFNFAACHEGAGYPQIAISTCKLCWQGLGVKTVMAGSQFIETSGG